MPKLTSERIKAAGAAAFILFSFAAIYFILTTQKSAVPVVTTSTPIGHTIISGTSKANQIIKYKITQYRVPILMYHYIRTVSDLHDKLGFGLSVTPDNFDRQMRWLSDNDYVSISLHDFCTHNAKNQDKPIVITFDDGYADAYTTAFPILQKYRFRGTLFIIKDFINHPQYLTTEQLNGLSQAGMEIGAHTMHHINLAIASPEKQTEEITGSMQSAPVFAYPSGRYTTTTINIVKKAGYKCAVTTHPGIATERSAVYELPRERISGGESLEKFIKQVSGQL